jgi:hypothetical protein
VTATASVDSEREGEQTRKSWQIGTDAVRAPRLSTSAGNSPHIGVPISPSMRARLDAEVERLSSEQGRKLAIATVARAAIGHLLSLSESERSAIFASARPDGWPLRARRASLAGRACRSARAGR